MPSNTTVEQQTYTQLSNPLCRGCQNWVFIRDEQVGFCPYCGSPLRFRLRNPFFLSFFCAVLLMLFATISTFFTLVPDKINLTLPLLSVFIVYRALRKGNAYYAILYQRTIGKWLFLGFVITYLCEFLKYYG